MEEGLRQIDPNIRVIGAEIHTPLVDIRPLFDPAGAYGFHLGPTQPGADTGLHWFPTVLQGHALTFGTSRQGGKGTSTIIPALLTYLGSMVVIDPKGENAWVTADRRRQLGQRVVIIDPWGEVNRRYGSKAGKPEEVTRFNPLSSLRADDDNFADDIAGIADSLIIPSGNDPHWTDSATELLAGLMASEVERKPGTASLRMVRRLLTATDEELSEVVQLIVEENPDGLAARKLGRFAKATGEVSSIRSTAMTQTAILDSPALLAGMETDETPFDLAEIAQGKVTVYLVIPPDRLQTHGRWLRMILTLMIRAVSRQDQPPPLPVVFLVDEAGTLNPVRGGGLKMLEQAFGLLAGLGVVIWMFFQDLNQMKRDYPDSWETFIANSAMIQLLNARDNTTSDYVAAYLGEKVTLIDPNNPHHVRGAPIQQARPIEEQKGPVMPAPFIRNLPRDQQMVILPGIDTFRFAKVPYFEEYRFDGMYRVNPLFPSRPPRPATPPRPNRPAAPANPLASMALTGLANLLKGKQ